jgi:XTP/dITP diphosphohydrolase
LTFENRGARFVCALVLARDGEVLLRAQGEVEGQVLDESRGADGFGYDPLFLVPGMGKTLAEMSPEEKWAVSHRGNAFRELLRRLAGEKADPLRG